MFKITVTEEDVKKSQKSAFQCVVAQALKRCFWSTDVGVTNNWLRIGFVKFKTPEAAKALIADYDNNKPLNLPVEFEVTEAYND